jgi:hypothetical protein
MELLTEILRYLMDKAGPLAVVLTLVLWWGYKLLNRKEDTIDAFAVAIDGMKSQMSVNREAQAKLITLLEGLIYGKNHG